MAEYTWVKNLDPHNKNQRARLPSGPTIELGGWANVTQTDLDFLRAFADVVPGRTGPGSTTNPDLDLISRSELERAISSASKSDNATAVMIGQTHTYATAQSTYQGKVIGSLFEHGGRIYGTYGDTENDTGPVWISSVSSSDPLGAWTHHLQVDSEQINRPTLMSNGSLIFPHIDPRAAAGVGYAERLSNGTWVDRPGRIHASNGQHVFDVAEVPGGRWLAAGADSQGGAIWSSTNQGATWTKELTSASATPGTSRFYNLVVIGQEVYALDQTLDRTLGRWYRWTSAGGWVRRTPAQFPDGNVEVGFETGVSRLVDLPGGGSIMTSGYISRQRNYISTVTLAGYRRISISAFDKVNAAAIGDDGLPYLMTGNGILVRANAGLTSFEVVADHIDGLDPPHQYTVEFDRGSSMLVKDGVAIIGGNARLYTINLATAERQSRPETAATVNVFRPLTRRTGLYQDIRFGGIYKAILVDLGDSLVQASFSLYIPSWNAASFTYLNNLVTLPGWLHSTFSPYVIVNFAEYGNYSVPEPRARYEGHYFTGNGQIAPDPVNNLDWIPPIANGQSVQVHGTTMYLSSFQFAQ